MIRLIIFLLVAAALATAAVWLANSPGEVVIRWQAVDTVLPLGLAAAIVAAIAAVAIVAYEIWRWVVGLPRRIADGRRHKRQLRGYEELSFGMIAAASGDVEGARVHTRKAERLLDSNPATLLLSAQTAQLEGKEDVAQLKFRQMLKRPATEFLGIRGLLADAVKRGDQEEALELARRAYERSPNTSWVLTTYFDLLTRIGAWTDALALVDDLAREKLVGPGEATRRRALLRHMLAGEALAEERLDDALMHARKATRLASTFAPAAVTASIIANRLGKTRQARRLLESCWRLEPHPELAKAYAELVPEESAEARLRRCERLADLRRDHLAGAVMMAELAMNARQWEAAKRHLDKALALGPTAGVYRLYADYERASGGGESKAREWLAKAVDAPLDKVWVCEDTGEVLPEWQLFGPTGRFDAVHWDNPPKVAPMLRDLRVSRPLLQPTEQAVESPPPGGDGAAAGDGQSEEPRPAPIEATIKAAGGVA